MKARIKVDYVAKGQAYFTTEDQLMRYSRDQLNQKVDPIFQTKAQAKTHRMRKFRQEASRRASMANKRLERLADSDYKDSPAYQKWVREGSVRFSVRGKNHNQLQAELSRMNKFLESATSTITGTKEVLAKIADNTGFGYKSAKDLIPVSKEFFTLASKVEQYLRMIEDSASAIGYQKIWEQINKYVSETNQTLGTGKIDVERATVEIAKAITEAEKRTNVNYKDAGFEFKGFFDLTDT